MSFYPPTEFSCIYLFLSFPSSFGSQLKPFQPNKQKSGDFAFSTFIPMINSEALDGFDLG